jgi:hypothetical protein
MAVGDGCEGGLEIGEGLYAVGLAGFDKRCDAAPGDTAFVMAGEERVLAIEGDGPDQVFDPVAVDLDAAVVQEGLQPVPVVMDVGELFAQAGFGGDLAALCLQPVAEGGHQRRGAGLTGREALTGRDAADVGLDGIEFGDAAQALGGDLRAVAVEDLLQFAPCVCPAMRHPNGRAALARGLGQPVVAGVAIDLQDAVEAGQEGFGILARASGGVEVDDAGRVLAAPGPVIAGQGPEVSGLCHAAPRVQHRGGGFIHEQLGRPFQMLGQPVDNGLEVERGLADPIGQHGAVQIEARPCQDLALAV